MFEEYLEKIRKIIVALFICKPESINFMEFFIIIDKKKKDAIYK